MFDSSCRGQEERGSKGRAVGTTLCQKLEAVFLLMGNSNN